MAPFAHEQQKDMSALRNGALIIDCRDCKGAQDLVDHGCMRCALRALSRAPSFQSLVLSNSQDVAYEGGCVQVLRDLTDAVRMCREGIPRAADRSCSNCPGRPSLLLDRMADSIPYQWDGQVPRCLPAQPRAKCAACSEKVNEIFSAVLAKMRCIERSSSREAFMVVGESGDA
ncbi:MAG: hypothetical protein LUQ16_02030 [Methanomassiliicoccales archaeon]|jgi:hypothetical protein|nr:hypothetical protein [Methanomassiliicoccales archaeon]MDD1755294.1 hypothetical protein [Methanomassiliicoccales archaeon]